jgi:hypothetical protein
MNKQETQAEVEAMRSRARGWALSTVIMDTHPRSQRAAKQHTENIAGVLRDEQLADIRHAYSGAVTPEAEKNWSVAHFSIIDILKAVKAEQNRRRRLSELAKETQVTA